jgi:SAM-dependent methyltransferase
MIDIRHHKAGDVKLTKMEDHMSQMAQKIQSAWKRHGFRIFGPLLIHNIRHYMKMYRMNGRLGQPKSSVDAIPGVETYRAAYFSELKYEGTSGQSANPYEPVREEEFDAVFTKLGVDCSNYHLVDIGSGKGRAVLLAARIGFKHITGVEYSKDLHAVAVRNIAAARNKWPNVDRITLVQGDASLFTPPKPPIIYYMCNPFGEEVMIKFMARVIESLQSYSGDVWIVYWNPTARRVIDESSIFKFQFAHTGHAVFRRVSSEATGQ